MCIYLSGQTSSLRKLKTNKKIIVLNKKLKTIKKIKKLKNSLFTRGLFLVLR